MSTLPEHSEDDYLSQVIDAAFLHSAPHCYYIGPFASRVSFASQQYRSIDLIEGLARERNFTADIREIAVVGAGLSGITLCTALLYLRRNHNLSFRITLFEKEAGPLERQKDASHRIIHPTISRWPFVPLEHTTRFPFLDWFTAPCNQIVDLLIAEWDTLTAEYAASGTLRQIYNTEVTALHPVNQLHYAGTNLAYSNSNHHVAETFDFVFMTTGYGPEREPPNARTKPSGAGSSPAQKYCSYWEPDPLSDPTTLARWRSDERPLFISGCGDGGLIDCLRFIHDDFRNGALAVELADAIQSDPDMVATLSTRLLSAEREIQRAQKARRCNTISSTLKRPRRPKRDAWLHKLSADHPYLTKLADAYENAISAIPDQLSSILNQSASNSNITAGKLTLLGHYPNVYTPTAAPIHKLMIAQALSRRSPARIQYKQANTLSFQANFASTDYGILRFENVDSRTVIQPNCRLIVRNGATSNIVNNIDDIELHSLSLRQMLLADLIHDATTRWTQIVGESQSTASQFAQSHGASRHTIELRRRYRRAVLFMKSILPDVLVEATPTEYRYRRRVLSRTTIPILRIRIPNTLFSYSLAEENNPPRRAVLL